MEKSTSLQYQSPLFYWGTIPHFEKGDQKLNECLWGLKVFIPSSHIYLPGGLAKFLVKKRIFKTKYGFEDSISNIDLGLFEPNNQLTLFW